MSEPIHDDELDTSEAVVRALLDEQMPALADAPLSFVVASGTDNALWRIEQAGADLVVRLARTEDAAARLERELGLLPHLVESDLASLVSVPVVRHHGTPSSLHRHGWGLLEWIDGTDMWSGRADLSADSNQLATDLAASVRAIGLLATSLVESREPGDRGGPLGPLLTSLERWLDDPAFRAADLVDIVAVRRLAAKAAEVIDEPIERGFVHGDLIAGNLLTGGDPAAPGRLSAIIDWGGAGHGDLAQDLAPAWSLLEPKARTTFLDALEVDEPTRRRAIAFELEHAIGGVLYYVPKAHPLGDVMARTLERLLDEE